MYNCFESIVLPDKAQVNRYCWPRVGMISWPRIPPTVRSRLRRPGWTEAGSPTPLTRSGPAIADVRVEARHHHAVHDLSLRVDELHRIAAVDEDQVPRSACVQACQGNSDDQRAENDAGRAAASFQVPVDSMTSNTALWFHTCSMTNWEFTLDSKFILWYNY